MNSPIRRIVVCLDSSPQSRRLGRQAGALARRLDAGLIVLWGLHRPFPPPADAFARGAGAIHEVLEHQALQEQALLSAARDEFAALAGSFGPQTEFRPVWDDDPEATTLAASGDLILVGHPRLPGLSEELTADRLLPGCGRPVLVVPADWTGELGGRALIGWNGSRAARQAVDDALPLIAADLPTTVLIIDRAPPQQVTTELTEALQAKGFRTVVKAVQSGGATVAETITVAAAEMAADLIVLGGYSRSPTIERWFGGVTRSLLASAPRPLLFSHVPDDVRRAAVDDKGAAVRADGVPPASFR